LSQTGDIRGDFLPLGQKQLAARRHHRLCTALPFPRLDWSDEDSVKASLRLHDYAIDLVNSAIDWYSRRIFRDRSWSWFFRGLSYLCAVVGAVLPLIKIFGPHLDKDLGARLGDPGGITAEFALVLIALAGGAQCHRPPGRVLPVLDSRPRRCQSARSGAHQVRARMERPADAQGEPATK